ncbi:MAG: HDIG domain protein [Parcubacteria group bacterium GW2011_GWB1_46_8]|nr:MAG: HDIG domain protein [Parcubacteria group bacterium GW2011_GWF1_45_5]KKU43990.1 MAG: HDIG domain protein [Parcubacteria group bacterium GW2011_GWA2_46_7]KKU45855.1 MAG: HDIG domain protein [Parcubacteria group bacterium GW2011_GWB1_46_8]KKU47699.1 MAG: HDIG domain protein [Parcubacteria group bacterium GW2011_GWF2_46_8]
MITREQALGLIQEHVQNKNIIKHMVALEAVMGALYDLLSERGNADLGGAKSEWMIAGLLHDGDYCDSVAHDKQGIQITQWAKDKGYEVPDSVSHAMAAHNWSNTGVAPENLMDWAIFCADSLTGLIVASALVLPDKKLANLTKESVLKRFKSPSFAAGTRREDIRLCEEKLGLSLEEFAWIALKAMQEIATEPGL